MCKTRNYRNENKLLVDMLLKQAWNISPIFVNGRIDYEQSFRGCSQHNYPVGGLDFSSKGVVVYETHQSETDWGDLVDTDIVVENYHFTRKQKSVVTRILNFWKKRYSILEKLSEKEMQKAWNYCHLKGEQQKEYAEEKGLVMVERGNSRYFLDYLKKVVIANNLA